MLYVIIMLLCYKVIHKLYPIKKEKENNLESVPHNSFIYMKH